MQTTEKKPRHPTWHYATIARLTRYKGHRDRIIYLTKELAMMGVKTTQEYTDMPHGSGTSDSTGDMASKISDKKKELIQAQNEVELIDLAVGMLSEVKGLIVRMRYLEEHKEATVLYRIRKNYKIRSKDTYWRMKDEAVKELADKMGEKKGE